MIARRSFLSMIGLAPVALASTDDPSLSPMQLGSVATPNSGGITAASDAAAREWVKANGIPDFVKDHVRNQTKESINEHRFDADIDAAKSFSLATKRRLQIDRIVHRKNSSEFARFIYNDRRDGLIKRLGGVWPFWYY